MSLSLKLNFNDQERRRLHISAHDFSLDQLWAKIELFFGARLAAASGRVEMQYMDEDREWVTFETEEEWTEAMTLALAAGTTLVVRIQPESPVQAPSPIDIRLLQASVNEVLSELALGLQDLKKDATEMGAVLPGRIRTAFTQSRVRDLLPEAQFREFVEEVSSAMSSASGDISQSLSEFRTIILSSPIFQTCRDAVVRAHQVITASIIPAQPQPQTQTEPLEYTIEIDTQAEDVVVTPTHTSPVVESILADALLTHPEIQAKVEPVEEPLPVEEEDAWSTASESGSMSPVPIAMPPSARFVRDVNLEDGSEVLAGTIFSKQWELLNTGASTWPAHTCIVPISENASAFQIPAEGFPVRCSEAGQTCVVEVVCQAPQTAGHYQVAFQLSHEGEMFGPRLWFELIVREEEHVEEEEEAVMEEGEESVVLVHHVESGQWSKQLRLLKEMGYSDEERLLQLLQENNGDVVKVVTRLL